MVFFRGRIQEHNRAAAIFDIPHRLGPAWISLTPQGISWRAADSRHRLSLRITHSDPLSPGVLLPRKQGARITRQHFLRCGGPCDYRGRCRCRGSSRDDFRRPRIKWLDRREHLVLMLSGRFWCSRHSGCCPREIGVEGLTFPQSSHRHGQLSPEVGADQTWLSRTTPLTVTTPTSGEQMGRERHSSVTSIRYRWILPRMARHSWGKAKTALQDPLLSVHPVTYPGNWEPLSALAADGSRGSHRRPRPVQRVERAPLPMSTSTRRLPPDPGRAAGSGGVQHQSGGPPERGGGCLSVGRVPVVRPVADPRALPSGARFCVGP